MAACQLEEPSAGLDDGALDTKNLHFLSNCLDKPFNAPFRSVIEAEIRVSDLSAFGRDLDDPAATLAAQVRQRGTDHLNRSGEIGGDLPIDLCISHFLGRAE